MLSCTISIDSINLEDSHKSVEEELAALLKKNKKLNEMIPVGSSVSSITAWRRRVVKITGAHIMTTQYYKI